MQLSHKLITKNQIHRRLIKILLSTLRGLRGPMNIYGDLKVHVLHKLFPETFQIKPPACLAV